MMYYEFTVGDQTYKLRLNTRNVVTLEKALGCNPLAIFGKGETLPTVSAMVNILHSSLQQYHHGITITDTYDLFDKYLAEGNTSTDFIPVIVEIYKVSGIIKEEGNNNEKN